MSVSIYYQLYVAHPMADPWQEIMDMIKYSSLRSPVICIHSNNAMHAWLTSPLQIFILQRA